MQKKRENGVIYKEIQKRWLRENLEFLGNNMNN